MTQSDDVRYLKTILARLRAWWRRRSRDSGQDDARGPAGPAEL